MILRRRIARLEGLAPITWETLWTPEREARAREIYERSYADPVRYADRIALFEQIKRDREKGRIP